jgi:hypothetical protein
MQHFSAQKTNGWCSVHTLANVFRDEDFFKYLDNPKYKYGTYVHDNEILKELGFDVFLNPLVNMPQNWGGVNKEFVIDILTNNTCFDFAQFTDGKTDHVFVYFMTVKVKPDHDQFHCVAVIRKGDRYIYSDPNFSEYIELPNVWDLFDYFEYCNAIEVLGIMVDNEPHFTALYSDNLGFNEIFDKERPIDYKAIAAN